MSPQKQLGIDIGSRTVKGVVWRDGVIQAYQVMDCGFEPQRPALAFLAGHPASARVVTGYGRHLLQQHVEIDAITEIKAHAMGARHLFPGCRTVLDVGGQDSKVIRLDHRGKVVSFQMNDKCAAGTGRFLEMMSVTMGYGLEAFCQAAAATEEGAAINSMCAVFAESEVVSLKHHGTPPEVIARSVHLSVVTRLAAMVAKVGAPGDHLVFTGGVANNKTLVSLLEKALGVPVLVPELPTIVGALGAALHAGAL